MHPGFLWRSVRLVRIALDAGADNVLPRRRAAAVARDDVVQIQILALEYLATVLARVFIALENVMARKFHFLLGQSIEDDEQNHSWNADAEGDRLD